MCSGNLNAVKDEPLAILVTLKTIALSSTTTKFIDVRQQSVNLSRSVHVMFYKLVIKMQLKLQSHKNCNTQHASVSEPRKPTDVLLP